MSVVLNRLKYYYGLNRPSSNEHYRELVFETSTNAELLEFFEELPWRIHQLRKRTRR